MKRFSSLLAPSAAALLLGLVACGDDSGETTSSATGTTSTGTATGTASSSPTSGPGGTGGDGQGGDSGSSSSGGGDAPGSGPGPTSTSTGTGGGGTGGSGSCGGDPVLPGSYDCACPEGTLGELVATEVLTYDGAGPMQFRQAPGDTDRFFLVDKEGIIYVVRGGVLDPTPFLDIRGAVQSDGEQGLLGLAFHPNFQTNGRFFIHYTSPETYVAEYTVSEEDPDVAGAEVGRVLQVEAFQTNHNGGAVEIGPDGLLYASVGDGGDQGDPFCRAQDLDNRAGKILRADISTPGAYSGAAGNFPGADEYVWDVGFRNPWRMSFDACTGDLWIGDVGQGSWEEVTVHPAGDGPLNHGWNIREGANAYSDDCPAASDDLTEPVLDYAHDATGGRSITGGYVYRGSAIPALRGAYLFSDFGSGRVWSTRWAPGEPIPAAKTEHPGLAQPENHIAAMGQDNAGEVYILTVDFENGTGTIYRIEEQ